jgi:hypothetical protein
MKAMQLIALQTLQKISHKNIALQKKFTLHSARQKKIYIAPRKSFD